MLLRFLVELPVTKYQMDLLEYIVVSFLNPPLVYVIKSPVVAQHYKVYFMMLCGMAGG